MRAWCCWMNGDRVVAGLGVVADVHVGGVVLRGGHHRVEAFRLRDFVGIGGVGVAVETDHHLVLVANGARRFAMLTCVDVVIALTPSHSPS